jgi:hypothetical protein
VESEFSADEAVNYDFIEFLTIFIDVECFSLHVLIGMTAVYQ